jgi:carbon-monoxide dehydrogenase iron sulfur subunit
LTAIKVLRADARFCDNCRMCELVCSLNKSGVVNPYLARIRVAYSEEEGAPAPVICRHCTDARCQLACPVPGAMYVEEATAALIIDESKCTRCMACVSACPFDAIRVGPGGEVLKCDLCHGEPVCVKHCPYRPENSVPNLPHPQQSCLKLVERSK